MCKQCKTKPVWKFTNKKQLCKSCFIKYFEKKILYTIRKFRLIEKSDKIYIDKKDKILTRLFTKFQKKFPFIEMVKSKTRANKIISPVCLDNIASEIIAKNIDKNIKQLKNLYVKQKQKNKTIIKPLYLLSEKEIHLYAKLKKIQQKKKKLKQKLNKKQKTISQFINKIEKTNPEVKHSIVNTYLEILPLFNNF